MSIINFIIGSKKTQIGHIELDATIKESHVRTSKITSFEVEEGAPVTDNIKTDPIGLSIEAVISGLPLGLVASLQGAGIGAISGAIGGAASAGLALLSNELLNNSQKRRVDALESLDGLWKLSQPFDVVTGLKAYSNMAIENINYRVDQQTGDSLFFNITLKEIRIVYEQSVSISASERAKIDESKQAETKGKVDKKEVDENSSKGRASTILRKLFDKATA